MIPLSVPCLTGNEIKYMTDALENGWVSSGGSYVEKFEENLSFYLNVQGVAALQSGTAALHLALLLSGVTNGCEVIVPTLTFIAAVNPVRYLGAEPIFMDCDDSLNLDCEKLERFLQKECVRTSEGIRNKYTNKIIKAIVVVHVFGNMADMVWLRRLADKYELKLIEDATESLGSCYEKGEFTGKFAGTIGDFGAYSFNGNKIITTGGGGMLVSKDQRALEKAKYLSTQAKDDGLYYIHNEIGYNYRMTNVQAALGVAQLERVEEFIQCKTANYQYYKGGIEKMEEYRLLSFNQEARNNYWFYSLLIEDKKKNKYDLLDHLKENQIQARPIWKLNHTQKMYQKNQVYYIEKALYYWDNVINIPCSVTLSTKEMDYIIQVIGEV